MIHALYVISLVYCGIGVIHGTFNALYCVFGMRVVINRWALLGMLGAYVLWPVVAWFFIYHPDRAVQYALQVPTRPSQEWIDFVKERKLRLLRDRAFRERCSPDEWILLTSLMTPEEYDILLTAQINDGEVRYAENVAEDWSAPKDRPLQ